MTHRLWAVDEVETTLAAIRAHAGFAITFIPFACACCRIRIIYICDAFIVYIYRLTKCLRMIIICAVFQIAFRSMISGSMASTNRFSPVIKETIPPVAIWLRIHAFRHATEWRLSETFAAFAYVTIRLGCWVSTCWKVWTLNRITNVRITAISWPAFETVAAWI